jgi:iron complex outermembrane receptor protein
MAFAMALRGATVSGAQPDAPDGDRLLDLRIDVTGSNLKRLQSETASPIQVITREELQRQGVVTAAQLFERLSANLSFNSYAEAQASGTRRSRASPARPCAAWATAARSSCSTAGGSRTTR